LLTQKRGVTAITIATENKMMSAEGAGVVAKLGGVVVELMVGVVRESDMGVEPGRNEGSEELGGVSRLRSE
jgi:hypothetical protein